MSATKPMMNSASQLRMDSMITLTDLYLAAYRTIRLYVNRFDSIIYAISELKGRGKNINIPNFSKYQTEIRDNEHIRTANLNDIYRIMSKNAKVFGKYELEIFGDEELRKHAERLNNLLIIARNNNVDSFNSIVYRVLIIWENCKQYDPLFLKNIMRILKIEEELFIPEIMASVGKIYKDMVEQGLIEDPNLEVGPANEPLFDYLPNPCLNCYSMTHLKLLADSRIDWSLYSNRENPFVKLYKKYEKALKQNNVFFIMYYHDAIMTAIKSSCSLFNDVFTCDGKLRTKPNFISVLEPLSRINYEFYTEIRKYLLSDEGFRRQNALYKFKNPLSDEALKSLYNERYYNQSTKKRNSKTN